VIELTSHEINTCKNITTAITESMHEVGYLNKKEIKEYIDFIFKTEKSKYKNLNEMKVHIFRKIYENEKYAN